MPRLFLFGSGISGIAGASTGKEDGTIRGGEAMPVDLFISHSWAYGDAYERLISLLNDAEEFITTITRSQKTTPFTMPTMINS
jgi:ABC-type glycerol-3-phosphate transport system substrate-binding protein